MSFISDTNSHSPKQEKKVANTLYISIVAAVIIGIILFIWVGQNSNLNPFQRQQSDVEQGTR